MPEELLRSAVSAGPSSRRLFVPVSIAVHGGVAVACFLLPLSAAADLPVPAPPSGIVRYLKAVTVPPGVATDRPPRRVSTEPRTRAAPVIAPSTIAAERMDPLQDVPEISVGGALPAESGFARDWSIGGPPAPPPQPPEIRTQPVRVGGGIREPAKIVHVAPVYPRFAQEAQIEGTVILEAVIAADGRIERVRVLRSVPLLDGAAITAVKQWRYSPTLLNNDPVPVLMTITVNFRLH